MVPNLFPSSFLTITADPSKTQISCPPKGIVGKPTDATITLFDEDGFPATSDSISVVTDQFQTNYEVYPNNASYNVSFVPWITGNYTVSFPINSLTTRSVKFEALSGAFSAENSLVRISRTTFTVSETATFDIMLLDVGYNLIPGNTLLLTDFHIKQLLKLLFILMHLVILLHNWLEFMLELHIIDIK